MSKSTKAVGTKFFKEGTQNQQILAKYWGNGKAFTSKIQEMIWILHLVLD